MLLGGISHKIFNPLSGITGPMENLKKYLGEMELKNDEKILKYISFIEESVHKID